MKLRMFRLLGNERGKVTMRGLLWRGLMLDICVLAVITIGGFQANASLRTDADAAAQVASIDLADEEMADGTARRCAQLKMSVGEFGAALRAGEVGSGAWNPETQMFIVTQIRSNTVRRHLDGFGADGSVSLPASCGFTG